MQRNLESSEEYSGIKERSDSIALIKLLEKICYSYRAHEYTPLGAWEALDKLADMKQPDDLHEVKHYESFRSVTEMCKASGVNFATMCSANVNMAMKTLKAEGKIADARTYEDGTYFQLSMDDRTLVDNMAKERCLSTRFLSLASNKLHSASKQELRNDMVKGEDKYPRTIAATLRFLQYHNLRGKTAVGKDGKRIRNETAFAQQGDGDDDNDDKPPPQMKSKVCGQWRDGTCPYKKRHTWKECPRNKYGINFGKSVDDDGELILCTIEEMHHMIDESIDAALIDRVYGEEGDEIVDLDNNKNIVTFYLPNMNTPVAPHDHNYSRHDYTFAQVELSNRIETLLSQTKTKLNKLWVLIDSQSTVDLFYNPDLLTNITKVDDYIVVHCNAGQVKVNMMGDLPGYGPVWYYADGIANILSLYRVSLRFHVQFDSRGSGNFVV